MVSVSDRAVLGSRLWQVPLEEFSGIAHWVRSSLSGVRHELHLVHADPGKSLLIHRADHISQATIDAAGALLGLPPIPVAAQPRVGPREGLRPALARLLSVRPLRLGRARRRAPQPERLVG